MKLNSVKQYYWNLEISHHLVHSNCVVEIAVGLVLMTVNLETLGSNPGRGRCFCYQIIILNDIDHIKMTHFNRIHMKLLVGL